MKTRSFIWLLLVFTTIVLGSSLFYRLQLLLGENTGLTTQSFFNPFLPQILSRETRIRRDLLQAKARTILGCTSFTTCEEQCRLNRKQCDEFVRNYNIKPQ